MDKKFVDSISKAWQEVYEKKTLDPVDHDELKGKHKDREDGDIDNDGDIDSSDKYLHKKRKAISKAIKKEEVDESSCGTVNASKKMKNEDDQEMDTEEPMSKDGMKKCKECGGSSENHDEECSQYASSEKTKASAKKEAIRHEVYGYGEIITETDNGFDILFAHGVEFNVPAEQCEGVSSAIKTAKKMSGNMTGAYKKIDKMKKGLADNPRVQKALKKANEEDELEEKLEKERVKHPNGQRPKGSGWVLKKSGEQSGKDHSEWERKVKRVESVQEGTVAELDRIVSETYSSIQQQTIQAMRSMWEGSSGAVANKKAKTDSKGQPADDQDDNLKGKGAVDMAKDIDAEGADSPKIPKGGDDEVGHDDASKAGRVTKAAPKRPADQTIGDKSIVNPVKKS
jgi:hypothetical protein